MWRSGDFRDDNNRWQQTDKTDCFIPCTCAWGNKFTYVCTVESPKIDFSYYGNLHNVDKYLRSQIIPYSILYIETSVEWKSPYSELLSNGQNQSIQIPLQKRTVSTYWCKTVKKYLLSLKTSAISIHSSMFQDLSALKERSCTLIF